MKIIEPVGSRFWNLDPKIVGRHEKQVMIRYQGACTTCPAGLTGTLVAIEGILKAEVDPEIVVITV